MEDDRESGTEPEGERDPGASRLWVSLIELFKTVALVLFLVVTIRTFVVEAYVVHGSSMERTFEDGDRLLIEKFAPRFESIERGDVIIFLHPEEPGKRLIKRVIALPGERVRIEEGIVYINGERLDESGYEFRRDHSFMEERVVEADSYFVLGDNRPTSNDSRRIGPVPRDAIVGKYLMKFFPLGSTGAAAKDR